MFKSEWLAWKIPWKQENETAGCRVKTLLTLCYRAAGMSIFKTWIEYNHFSSIHFFLPFTFYWENFKVKCLEHEIILKYTTDWTRMITSFKKPTIVNVANRWQQLARKHWFTVHWFLRKINQIKVNSLIRVRNREVWPTQNWRDMINLFAHNIWKLWHFFCHLSLLVCQLDS